jgi:hypothetical protein
MRYGQSFQVVGYNPYGQPIMGLTPMVAPMAPQAYTPGQIPFHPVAFGPAPQAAPAALGPALAPIVDPGWRGGQVAPGVNAPDEGMIALPMLASNGTGTFGAATGQLTFEGKLQKPFLGERLIAVTARVGSSATAPVLLGQIFVGTDLQQADLPPLPLEALGAPTAFGTRFSMQQAQPGVSIRILAFVSPAPTGGDTVTATLVVMGRVLH